MSEVVEMDSKAIDSFFSRIVGMIPLSLYRHTLSEDQNAADDMREGNSKYFKVVMNPCVAMRASLTHFLLHLAAS
jgi:hypothetical protein